MVDLADIAGMVDIQPDATVSRTVLKAHGARLVLFGFDTGQVLSEHTAAVPVMLQVLDGQLTVTANARTVQLAPGGLIHLGARVPHAVEALAPTRMLLTLLDYR